MTQVTKSRMGGSPFASEDNAVQDLSGWMEDSLDRTWTFASANAGNNTFVVYASGDVTDFVRVTMRLRAKQGAGYQYFITHDVSAYDSLNDRTEVTLFGGDHSVLSNAAITDVAFSFQTHPAGLPIGDTHWSVIFEDDAYYGYADTSMVDDYYKNVGGQAITLPVGMWNISYRLRAYGQAYEATITSMLIVLSENNTYQTSTSGNINETKTRIEIGGQAETSSYRSVAFSAILPYYLISVTEETTLYLKYKITSEPAGKTVALYINTPDQSNPTIIRAVSAYY